MTIIGLAKLTSTAALRLHLAVTTVRTLIQEQMTKDGGPVCRRESVHLHSEPDVDQLIRAHRAGGRCVARFSNDSASVTVGSC